MTVIGATVGSMNAMQTLDQIEAQVKAARAALIDEHEGNLTRAVLLIESDAADLGELVRTW